jgi:lipoic acid synthetase
MPKLPDWLKTRLSFNESYRRTCAIIIDQKLHTVCQGAGCPNRDTCFSENIATFMILGNCCTRSCRFCGVTKGLPEIPDWDEPRRVAEAVRLLSLDYAVITSVTRDDLADGGAAVFAATICAIRAMAPGVFIEVLTPDFQGKHAALLAIALAQPTVFNHNLETVPRLYQAVRPQADYQRSLEVIRTMKELLPQASLKSGIMVGLGESEAEISQTLLDLRQSGCDLVTIGQYLAPSVHHIPVARYVHPQQFLEDERLAYDLGFRGVASGPLVRSSYRAKQFYLATNENDRTLRQTERF